MSDSENFKKDIIFRAIKAGFSKNTFTKEELFQEIEKYNSPMEDWEKKALEDYLTTADNNKDISNPHKETLFVVTKYDIQKKVGDINLTIKQGGNYYRLNTDAKFKYIDFLELEQARKNARTAKFYAFSSIIVALAALVLSNFDKL